VGDAIADKYVNEDERFKDFYKYELPNVIAAACLAHDIGNPPFGHAGEDAIRQYFKGLDGAPLQRFSTELTHNEQQDFLRFEGNANALRTLTHAFGETRAGGYQLTYTTLASIVKYPCTSALGFNKKSLATKKSGFFDSEISLYENIANTLGIPRINAGENIFARHPFVFLVEAADDICYRIIDFEDAHRLGIVSLDELAELFLQFFDEEDGYNERLKVETSFMRIVDDNQKVQFLRARLINLLAGRVCEAFMANESTLLQGNLQTPLIELLPKKDVAIIKEIDAFSVRKIYRHRSVVEIEIAGYNVIGELLKAFTGAVLQPKDGRSSKLLQLIPKQFVITHNYLYSDLQSVVDFVTGCTDLYAVDLYRKICGIDFPQLH
jgi:dGTPase